jgi:chaperone modulatory protein CbpM
MIGERELLACVERLEAEALRRWLDHGWLVPGYDGDRPVFDEADVARVHLICDLLYEIDVGEESMPVILSLIDQLHTARRLLKAVSAAVEKLPDDARRQVAVELADRFGGRT